MLNLAPVSYTHLDVYKRQAYADKFGTSHRNKTVATKAPVSCAAMNGGTSDSRIPAKVSERERAMVTAGFANEVDAVNQ